MVFVTSKTRAGRAAVGARAPDCGGGKEGMARLSPAPGARHRTSGPTRPEDNRTTRRTLLACVASTPVAVAGPRACTWHQLAGWCHVAFPGVSAHDAPPAGTVPVCGCIVTALSLSDVGQAAVAVTTAGTVRVITSSE